MNKTELVEKIAATAGLTKTQKLQLMLLLQL